MNYQTINATDSEVVFAGSKIPANSSSTVHGSFVKKEDLEGLEVKGNKIFFRNIEAEAKKIEDAKKLQDSEDAKKTDDEFDAMSDDELKAYAKDKKISLKGCFGKREKILLVVKGDK